MYVQYEGHSIVSLSCALSSCYSSDESHTAYRYSKTGSIIHLGSFFKDHLYGKQYLILVFKRVFSRFSKTNIFSTGFFYPLIFFSSVLSSTSSLLPPPITPRLVIDHGTKTAILKIKTNEDQLTKTQYPCGRHTVIPVSIVRGLATR